MNEPLRPFHREACGEVAAAPAAVFGFLDDHRRLAAHMASASPMLAGGAMRVETDERGGRGLGARIRLSGSVLGLRLRVEETVTEYEPPWRKTWETEGEPALLVIGPYRMGLELQASAQATRLRVWIDYALPRGALRRMLGRCLGALYAQWCTRQMLRGCQQHFLSPAVAR